MAHSPKLPTALPGGMLMPHMSARARHQVCDTVFEMIGGVERLAHEAERSPEAYWEFMSKLWAKGLPRAVATEHSATAGVEALLDRLEEAERGDNAKIISGDIIDVVDDEA